MREVAGLRAIAPNRERLSGFMLSKELSYRECVRSIRVQSRTVHIEVAERDRFQSIHLAPDTTVEFSDILLESVRTFWIRRHRLRKRKDFLVSVRGTGSRIDYAYGDQKILPL